MTIFNSTKQSTKTAPKRSRRLISAVVAAVAALGMGMGAATANAGTVGSFQVGHVDTFFTSLNTASNKLQLGTNVDEDGYNAAWGYPKGYYTTAEVNAGSATGNAQYTSVVGAGNKVGSTWVIPSAEPTPALLNTLLYAGFAAAGTDVQNRAGTAVVGKSLVPLLAGKNLSYKLQVATAPQSGTVAISGASGSGTAASPFVLTYPVLNNEEAVHQHPQFTFNKVGQYTFKVTATVNGAQGIADSSAVYYRFDVQN